jgi:hypothetical protein
MINNSGKANSVCYYSQRLSCGSFIHGKTIRVANMLPQCLSHPPTWNNIGAWVKNALFPSQQQLKKSLNQKTKQIRKPNMGWDYFGATHLIKKETSTTRLPK